jgi:hypothetical protein
MALLSLHSRVLWLHPVLEPVLVLPWAQDIRGYINLSHDNEEGSGLTGR